MKKSEIEINDNEMSITNMPAIVIPVPTPLVRSVCYLPEHYPPFLKHAETESNCLCSFCAHARFAATAKEIKAAVKELPQIDVLKEEARLDALSKSLCEPIEWDKIVPGKLTRQVCDDGLGRIVLPDGLQLCDEGLDPIVLPDEEEILLQPVSRALEMPIPKLSRSTNDPSNWEPADDEEILLTGLTL